MSRTKHCGKDSGYEYWSRRKNKERYSVGRGSKKWTHGHERREAKRRIRVAER